MRTKLSFLSELTGVDQKAISTFGGALVALMEHLVSSPDRKYSVTFEVLIGHGLPPYAAGLIIHEPRKPVNRIHFFRQFGPYRKPILAQLLITRAITGVAEIADAFASRMNEQGGEPV